MTQDIFTNDFTTSLVDPIGPADSYLIADATPSLAASSVSGTQYRALIDTSNGIPYYNTEIITVTNQSGAVWQIQRATESVPGGVQQGAPIAHDAGVDITLIVTAATLTDLATQGGYLSLTGPGQSATPGELDQNGSLTVTIPPTDTTGFTVTNAGLGPIVIGNTNVANNQGTVIQDIGTGGIVLFSDADLSLIGETGVVVQYGSNSVTLFVNPGDPNGLITSNETGDLCFDVTTPALWLAQQTIGTVWSPVAGGGGGGSVSAVFGRTGFVTAQAGDYANFYDTNGKAAAASTAAIAASESYAFTTTQAASIAAIATSEAYADTSAHAASVAAAAASDPRGYASAASTAAIASAFGTTQAASIAAIAISEAYADNSAHAASTAAVSTSEAYADNSAHAASVAATGASDPLGYASAASTAAIAVSESYAYGITKAASVQIPSPVVNTVNGLSGNVVFFSHNSTASIATTGASIDITVAGGGGGGSVVSVFGRSGVVTAQSSDYSSFYDANGQASNASTAAINSAFLTTQAASIAAIATSESYADNSAHAASVAAVAVSASVKSLALLQANNLSDVVTRGTARANLRIPVLAPVQAATSASVNIVFAPSSVDGYSFISSGNDTLLLTGQTAASQNGTYVWNGASVALTRPTDFPSGSTITTGRSVKIQNGNTNALTDWLLTVPSSGITIDTSPQSWAQDAGNITTNASVSGDIFQSTSAFSTVTGGFVGGGERSGIGKIINNTFTQSVGPITTTASASFVGASIQPISTLTVTDALNPPTAGTLTVPTSNGTAVVTYTGWTPGTKTFTGVTYVSGSGSITGGTGGVQTRGSLDAFLGTPLLIQYNPTINYNSGTGVFGTEGPTTFTGIGVGPRGLLQLEGTYVYKVSNSWFNGIPPVFQNQMTYKNDPSFAANFCVGEGFVNVPTATGDTVAANFVPIQGNENKPGDGQNWTCGYGDFPIFQTINGGTLGFTNPGQSVSFYSMPEFVGASVAVSQRLGLFIHDVRGGASVNVQYGARIGLLKDDGITLVPMVGANTNIGIDCANPIVLGGASASVTSKPSVLLQVLPNTYTYNYASPVAQEAFTYTGTHVFQQSAGAYVSFSFTPTYKNSASVVANLGTHGVLSIAPTYQADGATVGNSGGQTIMSSCAPTFGTTNSGTLTMTQSVINYQSTAVLGAGATVSLLQGFFANNWIPGGGAVTTHVGVDVAALTGASVNVGIRNKSALWQQGALVALNNTVTVTTNKGTVPVTNYLSTLTNSSAAAASVTMATAGATDGQIAIVRFYDSSAASQTLTWFNTEPGIGVSVPAASNGSTSSPTTCGFMFNGSTSLWRILASA